MHLEIIISKNQKNLIISGNTFKMKDQIKSLGQAKWDSKGKRWLISGASFSRDLLTSTFPDARIIGGEDDSDEEKFQEAPRTINQVNEKKNSVILGSSSVLELNTLISSALSKQFPGETKVYGLISSCKLLSNGRIYFDLSDIDKTDCVVSCVVWEYDSPTIIKQMKDSGFDIENDLPVLVSAQIRLNPKRAQVSLSVCSFIPEYTIGKILAEREKTNTRLQKEGLFHVNKTRSLPLLPQKLGVLTSQGGTVINDFIASLGVCGFGFEIEWCPVRVQGRRSEREVIAGVEYLNARSDIDAILIFRGGGSASELGLFNTYEIARAVCTSSKPVFSAIGHEYDQCSVQDVSFLSFGVPKDIGRFFSDMVIDIRKKMFDALSLIVRKSEDTFLDAQRKTSQAGEKLRSASERHMQDSFHRTQIIVQKITERVGPFLSLQESGLVSFRLMFAHGHIFLENCSKMILSHERLLQAVSPEVQLQRGFSLIRDMKGAYITSIDEIHDAEHFQIQMKDGQFFGKKVITD
jgi:exodeoxyribonuclease VII large subunit